MLPSTNTLDRAARVGIAPDAGPHQELADLAAQALGVGDDRGQRDVVGHAVERAAERDQRARIVRHDRVLGIVEHGPGSREPFRKDIERLRGSLGGAC